MMSHIDAEKRGRFAESLCVALLWMTGWRIMERRMTGRRGSGLGEIDIVARRGQVIAFIEVKARQNVTAAIESITAIQRARIARAADVYLQRHPDLAVCDARFDVMVLGRGLLPQRVADAWRP
jgi:putative endonuclease